MKNRTYPARVGIVSRFVRQTLRRREGGRPGRVRQEGVVPVELVRHAQVGDLHQAIGGPGKKEIENKALKKSLVKS